MQHNANTLCHIPSWLLRTCLTPVCNIFTLCSKKSRRPCSARPFSSILTDCQGQIIRGRSIITTMVHHIEQ